MPNETILDFCFPFSDLDDNDFCDIFASEKLCMSCYEQLKFNPFEIADNFDELYNPDLLCNPGDLINNFKCNYRDQLDYNKIINVESFHGCMRVVYLNIRSLPKNLEEFISDFSVENSKLSVISFSETRLIPELANLYTINKFDMFSNPRNTRGGGVVIYAREEYDSSLVPELTLLNDHIETVFIEIMSNDNKYLIGSIYRPPSASLANFTECLGNLHDVVRNRFKCHSVTVGGDFNIDLFSCNTYPLYLNFLSCMFSNDFFPVILRPTRIGPTSATLIDHIWCNKPYNVLDSSIVLSNISDHYAVSCIISPDVESTPVRNVNVSFSRRIKNSRNREILTDTLSNFDWGLVLMESSAETAYNLFSESLFRIYDDCIPVRNITAKRLDVTKPYINDNIKAALKLKHKLQKLFNKRPISYGDQYRAARNKVNSLIKAAKANYFKDKLKQTEGDAKGTWEVINTLMGRKSKPGSTDSLSVDGEDISDKDRISQCFNKYFSCVGSDLASKITNCGNWGKYLPPRVNNRFNFNPCSAAEIIKIVKSLKSDSAGHDNIPTYVFKDNIDVLAPVIAFICNLSLSTGVFPSQLSIAKIICIFKSGDPRLISNYRPISVLCVFSKIIEKLVHCRLSMFFNDNDLLSSAQFGFREGLSTVDAVHTLINALYDSFDRGKVALGVFIDLQKAFDSIDRSKLIGKLMYYGVIDTELKWFQSYFHNRVQYVCFGDSQSQRLPVNFGVIQGSILGPLLFIIYINDIVQCSESLKYIIYADDTNVFITYDSSRLNDCVNVANVELGRLSVWLKENSLSLNVSKSQYMLFSRRKLNVIDVDLHVFLDGREIERVSHTKFLGCLIDENLLWNDHITSVIRKASKFIPILYNIRNNLDTKTLVLIYNSIIYPNLVYCNSVWGAAPKSKLHPLFVIQKKLIRLISFKSKFHPSAPLFKDHNILTLSQIYKYNSLSYVYRSLLKGSEWFIPYVCPINTRLASGYTLTVPPIMTTHSRQSVRWGGAKLWNSLPDNIKEETSYNSFKFKLKKYLLYS